MFLKLYRKIEALTANRPRQHASITQLRRKVSRYRKELDVCLECWMLSCPLPALALEGVGGGVAIPFVLISI